MSFFEQMKTSFVDVSVDKENNNAINTTQFLAAAEELTKLFDLLGSVAFNPVKNDIIGNINKIRKRQLAAPGESETLQELVANELKAKKHDATGGLLWLVRYALSLPSSLTYSQKELMLMAYTVDSSSPASPSPPTSRTHPTSSPSPSATPTAPPSSHTTTSLSSQSSPPPCLPAHTARTSMPSLEMTRHWLPLT